MATAAARPLASATAVPARSRSTSGRGGASSRGRVPGAPLPPFALFRCPETSRAPARDPTVSPSQQALGRSPSPPNPDASPNFFSHPPRSPVFLPPCCFHASAPGFPSIIPETLRSLRPLPSFWPDLQCFLSPLPHCNIPISSAPQATLTVCETQRGRSTTKKRTSGPPGLPPVNSNVGLELPPCFNLPRRSYSALTLSPSTLAQ